nr:MAG TPA: antitoxin [Caudoviricetes sp.]
MARPVSTKATVRFRLDKTVIADLDEMHWTLRRGTSEIVQDAITEYLAKNAPKSDK